MTIVVTIWRSATPAAPPPRSRASPSTSPKGKVAAVIGKSGAGKSTLLRCLVGLDPFDAGAIEIDGTTVAAGGDGRRGLLGKVGLVFQSLELFPHLSVLDNCTLAPVVARRRARREAEQRALRAARRARPRRQGARLPRRALRRPAPARRHRPRPRGRAARPALRRAHERARPLAEAGGQPIHPPRRREGDHADRGHARPRRGARRGGRGLRARGREGAALRPSERGAGAGERGVRSARACTMARPDLASWERCRESYAR